MHSKQKDEWKHTHTMRFHVDDSLSGHVDSEVNDEFSVWLNEQHGECGKVKATRGNEHDHLGVAFQKMEKLKSTWWNA